jgi:hypothetical protein
MEKSMSKFAKQIYIASLGAILIISFFHNSFGQMPAADKEFLDQKVDWNFENPNIYVACSILAVKGIPIGFEDTSDSDKDTSKKNEKIIHLQSGTLREILNSLIKQDPDYDWKVRDGVVNIYPVRARDEILKTLLETRFKSFSSKKEAGRKRIAEIIHRSAEVNAFLNSRKVKLGILSRADLNAADAVKDINISDIDLRGLLNQIVKDSADSKWWLVQRDEDGGIFPAF